MSEPVIITIEIPADVTEIEVEIAPNAPTAESLPLNSPDRDGQ